MNDFEGDIRQQAGQSQQVDVGFQCIRDIWQMRLHYINPPMNAVLKYLRTNELPAHA
jgi:hypothetical protein